VPDPENRKQIVYRLTEQGVDLLPVLLEIVRWGGRHDARTAAPKAFLDRVENDRAALVREMTEALKQRKTMVPA
jgi:DNA-binding HxlR family transcriptional regulator